MHIYRLAIELGLIEAKYLDHRARYPLAGTLSRDETQRLQQLSSDASQWGGWASEVHASCVQRNRQYRAYLIYYDEHDAIQDTAGGWRIHDYDVALDHCECMDFLDRKLPYKHFYTVSHSPMLIMKTQKSEDWGLYLDSPQAANRCTVRCDAAHPQLGPGKSASALQ